VTCESHRWTQKRLPCPWIRCRNGVRGHWTITGKKKRKVHVRKRIKDEWGSRYIWEETDHNPDALLVDDEEDDLVF